MPRTGGQIKQRRPYSRDWLPAPAPVNCPRCGTETRNPDSDAMRYLAWKQRLRDHALVGSDDARIRYNVAPAYADEFFGPASVITSQEWRSTGVGVCIRQSERNGIWRMSTGAIIGDGVVRDIATGLIFTDSTQNPLFEVRVKAANTTQQKLRFGLKDIAEATVEPVTNFVIVENVPAGAATNWFGNVTVAGVATRVDLGVAVTTTVYQRLSAFINSTANSVIFFVDDEEKGNVNVTPPTQGLIPTMSLFTDEAVEKIADCDYFRLWFTR